VVRDDAVGPLAGLDQPPHDGQGAVTALDQAVRDPDLLPPDVPGDEVAHRLHVAGLDRTICREHDLSVGMRRGHVHHTLSPERPVDVGRGVEPAAYPTAPSIWSSIRRLSSTAYSMGR